MKRTTLFVLVMFLLSAPVVAQNTVVGKWKPVRIKTPQIGEIPVEEGPLRQFAYEKTMEEKKGEPLTAEDSTDVEGLVAQMQNEFASMTMEFKANKSYSGVLQGKTITGTYVYNVAKKILTTKPAGKPARTARVSFLNGEMRLENIGQKVTLYLQRI
jgi:hypothetical protein